MDESLKKSAYGLARVFFAVLDREGFTLDKQKQRLLLHHATRKLSAHIQSHLVYPERVDQFKFISYIIYRMLKESNSGWFPDERNPIPLISKICMKRLNELLYVETSTCINLTDNYLSYIGGMLCDEIQGNCDTGMGENGLATTFTMLAKYGNQTPDLNSV